MSKEIVQRITQDPESFAIFTALMQSKKELFPFVIRERIFKMLYELASKYQLELLLNEEQFIESTKAYQGFTFRIQNSGSNRGCITFQFQGPNHTKLIFGITGLSPEKVSACELIEFNEEVKSHFGSVKSSRSWFAFTEYATYQNWHDLNTLGEILHGNFIIDFEEKLGTSLKLLQSLQKTIGSYATSATEFVIQN